MDDKATDAASELGRRWLPYDRGVNSTDLEIEATTLLLDTRLPGRNVKHFPMFPVLSAPY